MRQLKIHTQFTNRSNEALDRYLAEISREPLITPDEEVELARVGRKGGPEAVFAREKLVRANLRFVVSVAKQYQHQGLGLTDLISEGNRGLIKAAEKFDETRGFKFISYAVWWIRQSILQAVAEKSRMVRLPLNQAGAISRIKAAAAAFEQEEGRPPNQAELAEAAGIDPDKVAAAMKADSRHSSIDAPMGEDSDTTMADNLGSSDRADASMERESLAKDIDDTLTSVLGERDAAVVRRSFGIGCREQSADEIGAEMGLTRERVRQIRERSIVKMRQSGQVKSLAKYLG